MALSPVTKIKFEIKQAKQRQVEAQTRHEKAYARAYLGAAAEATRLFGLAKNKVTEKMRRQIATNDLEVSAAKQALDEAGALMLNLEERLAIMSTDAPKDTQYNSEREEAVSYLESITLDEYEQSGAEVLSEVEDSLDQVEDNLLSIAKQMEDEVGALPVEFWPELLERVTIYKTSLTSQVDVLRGLIRAIDNRQAQAELRDTIRHAEHLRDDCRSFYELARTRVRGW